MFAGLYRFLSGEVREVNFLYSSSIWPVFICLPCQTVRQFLRLNNISVLEFFFLSSPLLISFVYLFFLFFITATTLIINRLMSAEYSLKNC
uniref:Uncharacterized protein n=1 Tax=Glossina palpalis gambiensis TaxID=67801 RepID=A0A1B0B0H7_9MUSC